MANVIAVIWDFDKTLIRGYMQTPIFKKYKIDESVFWREVNSLPDYYKQEQGVQVNKDTVYLNHLIKYVNDGKLKGLSNKSLKEFGHEQDFYPGVVELIRNMQKHLEDSAEGKNYSEYNIRVENYIVSTGIKKVIEGTELSSYVAGIWGCELIDAKVDGNDEISEVGYTIDNTTKTRALFEINKGIPQNPDIDVNAKMSEQSRRVKFKHMIYIADGPSDVPAFSVINKFGGATFAVYPKGDERAFKQVEKLREDGRINMYAEADYTEGTTAYMWITNKVREFADQIYSEERNKLEESVSVAPKHII
ncbi:haloacid dehalogenase-like hydrolase [Allisonella histaminiformans]|uniref:HAD family hydrolase n=1 Tax=Allisonella histaminiformans TaxID=209880 RepID=UPI002942F67E|nr:haloacid dehalogenase-like hydrolase [Allisonella histaminiformans]